MPDDPTPPAARPNPPRPRAPRLPGTYAANYEGGDPSWRRGVAVLWVIFTLAAICEAVYAAIYFLQGGEDYPGRVQGTRLGAEGALFLALWVGWGWLRWPLAMINFFYGAWLVMWLIALHSPNSNAPPNTPPPTWGVDSIPILATAGVYLVSAAYVAFSADVLDFLRHQREAGRGWVAAPLAVMVIAYLLMLFGSQWFYRRWLDHEKSAALEYVTSSLEAISKQGWDAAVYEKRADPESLKTWYEGDRKTVFVNWSRLGAFRRMEHPDVTLGTRGDNTGGGYLVDAECNLGETEFAHGRMQIMVTLGRTLFGPWQLRNITSSDVKLNDTSPASTR